MANKWLIYASAYITYSLVHSIRTCWASLKTVFTAEPFQFSEKYLGTLDMIILFVMALLLNIFGNKVERYPKRKIISIVMVGLTIEILIIFILLLKKVTSEVLYFILFVIIGMTSCMAWPACLYTLSQYFDSSQAVPLSMYGSVIQTGDFVALLVTLIVLQSEDTPPAYSFLILMIIFILTIVFNYFFFHDKPPESQQVSALKDIQTPHQQQVVNMEDQKGSDNLLKSNIDKEEKIITKQQQQLRISKTEKVIGKKTYDLGNISAPIPNYNQDQYNQHLDRRNFQLVNKSVPVMGPVQTDKHSQPHQVQIEPPVNFLNVWLLPGVAFPVIALGTTKSINAIIVSWLVLYFNKIDMTKQSRVIAIVWTFSIVIGGLIAGKINKQLSYRLFILCHFIAGFVFYLLQGLHVHPNELAVISLIAICGILVGIPFNQLGTSVPLKLSQSPEIRNRPNAKSAIISLMQSFAQIMAGISIIIVPGIGVMRLHYMAGALCFASLLLLTIQQFRLFFKTKNQLLLLAKPTQSICRAESKHNEQLKQQL